MKGSKCEKQDCIRTDTTRCWLANGEEVNEYLCWSHAIEGGYCPCCGQFIAGTGEEDHHGGICDNCYDNNFLEPCNDDEFDVG